MADQLQLRGGTTAQTAAFTGALREVTVDTDKDTLVVHDGALAGGYPLMREDSSNSALALGSAATPSLKFTGDTNTGIYSPGADQVGISTGGTGRLFIDASGRVGIGVSGPSTTLDLAGSPGSSTTANLFTLRNQSAASAANIAQMQFFCSNTFGGGEAVAAVQALNPNAGANNGGALAFAVSSNGTATTPTERMRLTPTGLGIGTTGPTTALDVNTASGNSQVRVSNGTYFGYLGIDSGFNGLDYATTGSHRFRVSGSYTTAATIDSSGRLLVGTSSAHNVGGALGNAQFSGAGTQVHFVSTSTSPSYINLAAGSSGTDVTGSTTLGRLRFYGYHTNGYDLGAQIEAAVDGTPSDGDIPTRLVFSTTADGAASPTERMRITSAGNVGIGTTSPSGANLVIDTESNGGTGIRLIGKSANDGSKIDFYADNNSTRLGYIECNSTSTTFYSETNVPVRFFQNGGEAFRVDTSKRLLVGTSGTSATNTVLVQGHSGGSTGQGIIQMAVGSATPSDGSQLGKLQFSDNTHAASCDIVAIRDGGTWSASSKPTSLVFSTTADGSGSPTERMRINSGGTTICTAPSGINVIEARSAAAVTSTRFIKFNVNTSTEVGSIQYNGSGTNYVTSSDYRLKENLLLLEGAISRVSQLPVYRFNFISNPDQVVDGFLAHEVQTIVPEAITGEKDAVDDEGNPQYQGIDQSKLVPLLTAALQEAVAKIETLEGMVAVNNITIDEQQHQLSTLAARLTALESA